jgi:hypothetical protein
MIYDGDSESLIDAGFLIVESSITHIVHVAQLYVYYN